jgi:sulfur carrier protein
MQIKVNGEHYECQAANVSELTQHLRLNLGQIAIERNREIVPRSRYAEVALNEGDEIEIVRFIGGG